MFSSDFLSKDIVPFVLQDLENFMSNSTS